MRNLRATLMAVLLACAALQPAFSLSLGDREVSEIYRDSRVVAEVRVAKISAKCEQNETCLGYRIEADVEKHLKGPVNSRKRVSMCSLIPLEIGLRYTLFLADPSMETSQMEGCKLVLGYDGAFEKRGTKTYRINSPDGRVIAHRFGQTYYTAAILVEDFEQQVAKLLNAEK